MQADSKEAKLGESMDAEYRAHLERCIGQLMDTPEGREVIYWLLFHPDMGGLQSGSYPWGAPEAQTRHLVMSGRRELAIDIQVELQRVAPAGWLRMLMEQTERELKLLQLGDR